MLGRTNSAQRSFKPVLQKRDSRERMWPRGPPPPVARSTSADRRRPRVNPVRRPCRTLSPPEQNRKAPLRSQGNGSFAPPLATPPIGNGPLVGGSGCPHRFRGAALEGPDHHHFRGPPTSAPPSAVPRVMPPSADFDTPRSPSLKEDSRSSPPSTVPQVLSGTPGSPPAHETLPEFEGLCAVGAVGNLASGLAAASGVVTPQQPLCLETNWKFSLENEHAALGAGG